MRTLENFGRERLSRYFFMRDFLYSEIANMHGVPNLPSDPELAIEVGRKLCGELLDPIVETFGPIHVRSSFRSAEVNDYGCRNKLNCASNEANYAGHILGPSRRERAHGRDSPASSCSYKEGDPKRANPPDRAGCYADLPSWSAVSRIVLPG